MATWRAECISDRLKPAKVPSPYRLPEAHDGLMGDAPMPKGTWQGIRDLEALRGLQADTGKHFLAPGFELIDFGDEAGVGTWSQDPEFLGSLHTFAQANASGSHYAIWRVDDRPDPASLPAVVFGDEGGLGVVARSLPELFQQVASGQELLVDDYSAWFYRVADDDQSARRTADEGFLAWLADSYGLAPAENPAALIDAAVREYGELFARWMGRFVDDEDFVDEFLSDIGVQVDEENRAGVSGDTGE
jgi:hypothetical protein